MPAIPQLPPFLFGRKYEFELTAATERRLAAYMVRGRRDDPEWPDDETYEQSLDICLGAVIDHGLEDSEKLDRVQANLMTGEISPRRPLPLRLRVKLAWRELRGYHAR